MSQVSNQPQIAIEKKILKDISSAQLLYFLSKPLKKYLRFCVPVNEEGLREWLEGCDINFQSNFKAFYQRYPSRIEFSPMNYQHWDHKIEEYSSVDDFDNLFNKLDGFMIKDINDLEGYQSFSPNITSEGLYLSSEEERFQNLLDDVQTFCESGINPGEIFNNIWFERFHNLVLQSHEIDIVDKYNFHPTSGPNLNLFFDKIEENIQKYQNLNIINFIFDPTSGDSPNRQRLAEDFIERRDLKSRFNINIITLPPHESRDIHERCFIFYFKKDNSYGLVLDMGLPANLFQEEIQRPTTASLSDLESRQTILRKRMHWLQHYRS